MNISNKVDNAFPYFFSRMLMVISAVNVRKFVKVKVD